MDSTSVREIPKEKEVKNCIFETRHWIYIPEFLPSEIFSLFLPRAIELSSKGNGSRLSCVFSTGKKSLYKSLVVHSWENSPTVNEIRCLVEKQTNQRYDYCLLHVYRNGEDCINWHNDSEALNTNIASVSLGYPRKFRIRRLGQTKGWEEEVLLGLGDLFIMKAPSRTNKGFQELYQHCVPKEKRVKNARISLTFRQIE